MKENTSFLKAAGKAAWLPALLPALGLVASALLTLAGCPNDATDGGGADFMYFDVNDDASLSDTFEEIKAREAPSGGEYIINVTADIESGGWLIAGDQYNGKRITIKSDNEAETRSIQYTKTVRFLFEVANGELTLGKGLELVVINDNDKALCRAIYDGTLILTCESQVLRQLYR